MKKVVLLFVSFVLTSTLITAQAQIITTIAGNGTKGFSVDGTAATACEFAYPSGLFMDRTGNMYFTDDSNFKVRMINTAGIVSTLAGNGIAGYSGDGFPATDAQLNQPWKVVVDTAGNIYIADVWNQLIRKVNTSGIITTYAGNYLVGSFYGDGGPATAAFLNHPVGLAIDKTGNLYIGDVNNNVIRKINTSGVISTVAGNFFLGAGSGGDGGPATDAQLNLPYGIAIDSIGNLYIGDAGNNKVRMVNTSGIISTIAGIGSPAYSGDGGPATAAQLSRPMEVFADNTGNVLICDANNNCIRKIDATGIITTFAGKDTAGYSGDGGSATNAKLNYATGLTRDLAGNMIIADELNHRVRKVHPPSTTGIPEFPAAGALSVFPNPANGLFTLQSVTALNNATVEVYNITGEKVFNTTMSGQQKEISLNQPNGLYILYLKTEKDIYRQKVSIVNK